MIDKKTYNTHAHLGIHAALRKICKDILEPLGLTAREVKGEPDTEYFSTYENGSVFEKDIRISVNRSLGYAYLCRQAKPGQSDAELCVEVCRENRKNVYYTVALALMEYFQDLYDNDSDSQRAIDLISVGSRDYSLLLFEIPTDDYETTLNDICETFAQNYDGAPLKGTKGLLASFLRKALKDPNFVGEPRREA